MPLGIFHPRHRPVIYVGELLVSLRPYLDQAGFPLGADRRYPYEYGDRRCGQAVLAEPVEAEGGARREQGQEEEESLSPHRPDQVEKDEAPQGGARHVEEVDRADRHREPGDRYRDDGAGEDVRRHQDRIAEDDLVELPVAHERMFEIDAYPAHQRHADDDGRGEDERKDAEETLRLQACRPSAEGEDRAADAEAEHGHGNDKIDDMIPVQYGKDARVEQLQRDSHRCDEQNPYERPRISSIHLTPMKRWRERMAIPLARGPSIIHRDGMSQGRAAPGFSRIPKNRLQRAPRSSPGRHSEALRRKAKGRKQTCRLFGALSALNICVPRAG